MCQPLMVGRVSTSGNQSCADLMEAGRVPTSLEDLQDKQATLGVIQYNVLM